MKQYTIAIRWVAGVWLRGCLAIAAVGSLILLWAARDAPLELGPNIRADALSAFFCAALLAGLALQIAFSSPLSLWPSVRVAMLAAGLLVTFCATQPLLIAGGCVFCAVLARWPDRLAWQAPGVLVSDAPAGLARRVLLLAPELLAATCLLFGYGTLAARGAVRYTDPSAGAALSSFVFWFVLLAAAIPLVPFSKLGWQAGQTWDESPALRPSIIICFYPLLRLYSLGPWNTGWLLAALLLGGALASWCAISAIAEFNQLARSARVGASYLGLALAGIGLGTGAGLAAACYAILAYQLLCAAYSPTVPDEYSRDAGVKTEFSLVAWLIAGVFPFSAPFVAIWLAIGASIAGGATLLAGLAWLVGLLNGLSAVLWGWPIGLAQRRRAWFLAATSVALGISAPVAARVPIGSVAAQLQGGLTPFGNLELWPWVGLATNDAAHTQVATWPSIALALLMLVLAALVYVAGRLGELYAPALLGSSSSQAATGPGTPDLRALLQALRDDVPWLALLVGAGPEPKKAPRERE